MAPDELPAPHKELRVASIFIQWQRLEYDPAVRFASSALGSGGRNSARRFPAVGFYLLVKFVVVGFEMWRQPALLAPRLLLYKSFLFIYLFF